MHWDPAASTLASKCERLQRSSCPGYRLRASGRLRHLQRSSGRTWSEGVVAKRTAHSPFAFCQPPPQSCQWLTHLTWYPHTQTRLGLILGSTPKRANAHAMDSSDLRLFHPSTPTYSLDPSSPYGFPLHTIYLIPYRPSTSLFGKDSTPHDSFLG